MASPHLKKMQLILDTMRKVQYEQKQRHPFLLLLETLRHLEIKVDWPGVAEKAQFLAKEFQLEPLPEGLYKALQYADTSDDRAAAAYDTVGESPGAPPVSWPIVVVVVILVVSDGPSPVMDALAVALVTGITMEGLMAQSDEENVEGEEGGEDREESEEGSEGEGEESK